MMSTMKLAAVCCAVGASATALDAAGLVQSSVNFHVDEEELAQVMKAPAFKINSKTAAQSVVRLLLQDGRRWVQLLWGNKTRGLGPDPLPAQEAAAGCSEADHQMADKRAREIEEDVMQNMANMLPKIMKEAQKAARDPFGGSDISSDTMASIMGGDLAEKVPKACKTLLTSEDLHWTEISRCIKAVIDVSDSCLNCVPQFGIEVQKACETTCENSLTSFTDRLDKAQDDVEVKMKKKMGSFSMPSQSDMMEVVGSLQSALSEGIKDTVPCLECVQPKTTSFVKCMMGDEIARAFGKDLAEVVDEVRSGHLVPEIIPMGGDMPMGMPMGSHMPRPTVPL